MAPKQRCHPSETVRHRTVGHSLRLSQRAKWRLGQQRIRRRNPKKGLTKDNKWKRDVCSALSIQHLEHHGVFESHRFLPAAMLLEQGLKAMCKAAVPQGYVLEQSRDPKTILEALLEYGLQGTFSIEVDGIAGTWGTVQASATMKTEDLAIRIQDLTSIPPLEQRLSHNNHVLMPATYITSCGVGPLSNRITLVRAIDHPANPVIQMEELIRRLDGLKVPRNMYEWKMVQDRVWPGAPPLRDGWVRVLSTTIFSTYFYKVGSRQSTWDFNIVRREPPLA